MDRKNRNPLIVEGLNKSEENVNKALNADNLYRNLSWVLLGFFLVVAFLISLGNCKFDFMKILEAQFWIDFSFTFFGSQLLRYFFGKWGGVVGHQNKNVIEAINNVNDVNEEIREQSLVDELTKYIDKKNRLRKLKRIRNRVYLILRSHGSRKKYLQLKESVLLCEKMLNSEDPKEIKECKEKLDAKNFDIDTFRWSFIKKVKYPYLNQSSLQSGFASKASEDSTYTYSEMYELFGKNIILTVFFFVLTLLFAVTTVMVESVSWNAVFVFATRVTSFVSSAYLGFAIGKSGVETIKLGILQSIHNFLSSFVEVYGEDKVVK